MASKRDHAAEWQRRNQLAQERGYRNASDQRRQRAAYQPAPGDTDYRGPRAATIGRRPAVVADDLDDVVDAVDAVLDVESLGTDERGVAVVDVTVTVQTPGGPRSRSVTVPLDMLDEVEDLVADEFEAEYGGNWHGAPVVSVVVR